MSHLPFGLKMIFFLLVIPVLIGYGMVFWTLHLQHSSPERKTLLLQMEKYKVRGVASVEDLDVLLSKELHTFLSSRWLAISIVQVVLAFGLLWRAPWIRVGMVMYLAILLLLQASSILTDQPMTQAFVLFKLISIFAGLCTILYLQHPKTRDEFY